MWNQIPSLKETADAVQRQARLKRIVEAKDTAAMEVFCLGRTYQQVQKYARDGGVDLEELEELLQEIS